jgi:flagellar protein FlaG
MQLEDITSTAAHLNPAAGLVHRRAIQSEVPRVRNGATDTTEPGVVNGVEEIDVNRNIDADELQEAVQEMRKYHGWGNFNIDFDRDDETNSLIVKIIDRDTGEVLRQIPPDQILKMRHHLREALGLVFDHMA